MSASFIAFTEGENYILTNKQGIPSSSWFMLCGSPVAAMSVGATLGGIASTFCASWLPEITGTGYVRASQAAPVPSQGNSYFTQMSWATGNATDWPNHVASIVLCSSSDNSGKLICAWNLIASGAVRDMSQQNTTEQVTPTLTTSS